MIGYITIGVKDIKKAVDFYVNLLEDLGVKVVADRGRLVALGHSMLEPLLAVCIPSNGLLQARVTATCLPFPWRQGNR